MNYWVKIFILFFVYLSFNIYADNAKASLTPVKITQNQFLLFDQDGTLISSPPLNKPYSQISYDPILDNWNAVREENILWSPIKIEKNVTYFFNKKGDFIKHSWPITYLGADRFLLFAPLDDNLYIENKYLLNQQQQIITKLDSNFSHFVGDFDSNNQLIIAKSQSDKYGYINRQGQWQIPPVYSYTKGFNGNHAQVTQCNNRYIIDHNNNQIFSDTDIHWKQPLSQGYWVDNYSKSEPTENGYLYTTEIRNANNNIVIRDQNVNIDPVATDLFIMEDIKTQNTIHLLDTRSGELISYPNKIISSGYSSNIKLNDHYFWAIVVEPKRKEPLPLYRLLDRKGNTLLENRFYQVNNYYGEYAWVKLKETSDWQLINLKGKIVSDSYENIEINEFGQQVLTYAEKNNINYTLNNNGSVLFYSLSKEQYLSKNNKIANNNSYQCLENHSKLVLNAKNEILWPSVQDAKLHCIANQNYNEIPDEQKIDYIVAVLTKQQNLYLGTDFHNQHDITATSGPALINLNNIAELNLPDGYIYLNQEIANKDQFDRDSCQHSIVPKYNSLWRLCVNIDDIGHVNQQEIVDYIQQNPKNLANQILKRNIAGQNTTKTYFNWITPPEFNEQNKILNWDYQYIDYNQHYGQDIITYRNASSVKFGRDHVIWLTNLNYFDTEYIAPQFNEWQHRIQFKKGYQYQDSTIQCDLFSPKDKNIFLSYYDYQSIQRCYFYGIERFFNINPYVDENRSIATQLISKNAKPNQFIINTKRENTYGYY